MRPADGEAGLKDTVARSLPCWHDGIAPALRSGQSVLIAGHGNGLRALVKYLDDVSDANLNRTTLYHNTRKLLENFDVLACPTVGNMPRPIEVEWVDTIDGQKLSGYMDWLRFAFLSTTTGLPSISVPVGLGVGGMPVGLQLIGPPRGEAKLLAVARAVEAACGGPLGPIDPNVWH